MRAPDKLFAIRPAQFNFALGGVVVRYHQQPAPVPSQGIKRTLLQKVEVPGTTYEAILAVYEIPAGMNGAGILIRGRRKAP